MVTHLIKSRHNIVRTTNATRACLLAVIDANLIGYKDPAGADAAKHVDLITSIFSINDVSVQVYADHPTKRYGTKRESVRRRRDKERTNLMLLEKNPCYPPSCSI